LHPFAKHLVTYIHYKTDCSLQCFVIIIGRSADLQSPATIPNVHSRETQLKLE